MSHENNYFEEEDDWIPLNPTPVPDESSAHATASHATCTTSMHILAEKKPSSHRSQKSDHQFSEGPSYQIQKIRNHHERKKAMKTHLVDKPFSRFPILLLYHLMREILLGFRSCHRFIHLGELFSCTLQ